MTGLDKEVQTPAQTKAEMELSRAESEAVAAMRRSSADLAGLETLSPFERDALVVAYKAKINALTDDQTDDLLFAASRMADIINAGRMATEKMDIAARDVEGSTQVIGVVKKPN